MEIASRSRNLMIAVSVVVTLAAIGGWIFHWYPQYWWFDLVLHTSAGFAVSLALGLLLYGTVLTGLIDQPGLLVLTIALLGLALGACWEIGEFSLAGIFDPGFVSRADTVTDLMVDALGAGGGALLSVSLLRKSQSNRRQNNRSKIVSMEERRQSIR